MATYSEFLRARTDAELVALLLRRPDLASPSPSTLSSLAARATSRVSLDRALSAADAATLQAVESVVALHEGADGQPGAVRAGDVLPAVGVGATETPSTGTPADPDADAALVTAALDRAVGLALLHPEDPQVRTDDVDLDTLLRPAPGLSELFGPHPAGLAAPAHRQRDVGAPALLVGALVEQAPEPARAVLDALTWGPPVGVRPRTGTPAAEAVAWLLEHGLLGTDEAQHVVLPRQVALVLRGGRTHREPARPPRAPVATVLPERVVAAESVSAAERVVRLVAQLVHTWEQTPPPVLRSGGLGVRELRRTAVQLEVDDTEAGFVVELAGAAGLVADDGEERPGYVPTLAADEWLAGDLPHRWALLARTWLTTTRAAWVVGTRDDRGLVRAALSPEPHRTWAPRMRRAVLDVLADVPPGTAPTAGDVLAVLGWRTPRAVPPAAAVEATLREAGLLGVLGAGALSPAGHALLAETTTSDADPSTTGRTSPAPARPVEEALAASLPRPVDELLLQADLTGIVPGRPTPELEALLTRTARAESRGGALTVRFTPESVRAALDAGSTAEDLLAELAAHARGAIPQPLEYLVRDAARRHGRLRAGVASSYLRADDPALVAELAEDPALAALGLVRLAPTVLAAQVPTGELLRVLRAHGLSPVAEAPDGRVVHAEPVVRRVRGRRPARDTAAGQARTQAPTRTARLTTLVAHLRAAEAADRDLDGRRAAPGRAADRPAGPRAGGGSAPSARAAAPDGGTADPVAALGLLREAVADHTDVWLEVVGPQGSLQRRRVRPLRLDGGRLRAIDPSRDAELTVAVHRIASVSPIPAEPAG
ncbi:hypothetical protein AGMMS50218_15840 [Actinomycetota bacterium]|nr:hypothetical protein AGMMS50218_15840 [Actinomycetota bacterium]